jgi:hypothetical protein
MKKITLLFSALVVGMIVFAQDCESFFPLKKGAFMEMKSYDEKGKHTGTVRQTVTDVTNTAKGVEIKVSSEQLDDKNKSLSVQDLEMRCENGVFYMDMKNYFNQAAMGSGQNNTEMSIDATDLVFPSNLKVGETLPDGSMTISMPPLTMGVNIFNRKVVSIEDVKTPAGTFEGYKITYDIETKIPFKMTNSAIQWYAKEAGAVRTETYNKKGKLIGYTELTEIRK